MRDDTIITPYIDAEALVDFKFDQTPTEFLCDRLDIDQDDRDRFEDAFIQTMGYEEQLIVSVILHTLETVRGADRRDLLDDLSCDELIDIVFTDVGLQTPLR